MLNITINIIIILTIITIIITTTITMITTSGHLTRTNGSVPLHREQQDPALGQQEDHPDR